MPAPQATSFDDDLKAVNSDFASDLKAVQEHVAKGEPVPHPLVARLLDWLPAAGGAVGGLVGGALGLPEGGIGAIPGAIGGAAFGGAEGAAVAGMINHAIGNTPNLTNAGAAKDVATQAAIQGGSEAVGAGLGAVAKPVAQHLMQSAVKPAYALMSNAARKSEVPRVVQTLLKEGVNVTPGGVRKVNDLLTATNDQIASIIKNSNGVVYPEAVASRVDDVEGRLVRQVAPLADLGAARGVKDEFMQVHGGAPPPGSTAATLPAKPIPVQRAQELKVGTYRAIGNRAYGEVKGAQTEAEKALARGLKEDIETAVGQEGHDIKSLNARDAALMEARDAIAKRVALANNRDPGGIGWIAENPRSFIAFLMARSPAVKSMLARGLYQSAGAITKVSPQLIRTAIASIASSRDEDTAR